MADLHTSLQLVDGQDQYEGFKGDNPPIALDFSPPHAGYGSLDLVMLALSSCMAATMAALLRNRIRKTLTDLRVDASGTLQKHHPKKLSYITLHMTITSPDIVDTEVDRMLVDTEEKLCPVWAMLKGNTEVAVTYTIVRPEG